MFKFKINRSSKAWNEKFNYCIQILWGEQKPFQRRGLTLSLALGESFNPTIPSPSLIKLDWGPGAGYIGGFTAFVARNCKGKTGVSMYVPHPWQYAITRYANKVPHHY